MTGIPILQVTNHPSINHPTYFLQSSFLPDGSGMIFTSYRTGSAQLFEASLRTGELKQLTDGPAIHPFSPAISGEYIYFVRGGSIWRLQRSTLVEEQIVAFENGQLGECSLGANGEWLTAAIKLGAQSGIVTGRADGSDWKLIPFERTVIHPQFHPLEPEWLIFAGDPAPRMFRVRRNGSGMECLHQHGNDEFVVHETFLGQTGDIVFTIWPRLLCRMDWTTRVVTPDHSLQLMAHREQRCGDAGALRYQSSGQRHLPHRCRDRISAAPLRGRRNERRITVARIPVCAR